MKPIAEIAAAADRNFVGRLKEIDIFQKELERLGQGRGPDNAVLAIYGETGIGKTRLINNLEANAAQNGALTTVIDLHQAKLDARTADRPLLDQVILQIGDGLSMRSSLFRGNSKRSLGPACSNATRSRSRCQPSRSEMAQF